MSKWCFLELLRSFFLVQCSVIVMAIHCFFGRAIFWLYRKAKYIRKLQLFHIMWHSDEK